MAYEQKQYTESDAVKKWREQMEAQQALMPKDFQSQYRPQIDQTIDSIMNRKPFQYDVNADVLYHQLKDHTVNLGQQAMMDTMGQAAQLTGGYGNSYAQMAGQQAYQGYLQGLTDKIPELAQLAQAQYDRQGQDLYQQYGLLSGEDQKAYDQWLQGYNRWLAERDYNTGRFDTERGYDYGQYRDTVGDEQWKAQFDEDLRRFNFANGLGEFAPAPVVYSGGGDWNDYTGSQPSATEMQMDTYVKNMLNGISGSAADPSRIINSNSALTKEEKAVAQDILKTYVNAGAMKTGGKL